MLREFVGASTLASLSLAQPRWCSKLHNSVNAPLAHRSDCVECAGPGGPPGRKFPVAKGDVDEQYLFCRGKKRKGEKYIFSAARDPASNSTRDVNVIIQRVYDSRGRE